MACCLYVTIFLDKCIFFINIWNHGLSFGLCWHTYWCKAITKTNAEMLLVGPLGINFCEISINMKYLIQENVIHCLLGVLSLVNSLALGKFEWKFRYVILPQILETDGWGISCEIALIWMSLDLTDDQSTLVQVMAWCRQATSHYLSQCWPRSLSPYGVTRPQWVNHVQYKCGLRLIILFLFWYRMTSFKATDEICQDIAALPVITLL